MDRLEAQETEPRVVPQVGVREEHSVDGRTVDTARSGFQVAKPVQLAPDVRRRIDEENPAVGTDQGK